ncbi:MAG: AraC family transcriptional regulator [Myxococcota bacterium]
MDVLSQILRSHSAGAVLLSRCDYREPWGVALESTHTAGLHFVESGSCYLRCGDREPFHLLQGDVAVLPHGSAHVLSDSAHRRAIPLEAFLARPPEPGPYSARVICAAQRFELDPRRLHPLFLELPSVIHLEHATIQSCAHLGPCLRLLLMELQSETPGRGALVALLLEAFLAYVIRHWIQCHGRPDGWVGVLRDSRLSRVVSSIHEEPERGWTVAELASLATMSRPAFAKSFVKFVGESPLAYVIRLRMERAGELLRQGDESVAEVAQSVGYASEFAFSRAFKRVVGVTPSFFRTM